jgi:hypothetical protein
MSAELTEDALLSIRKTLQEHGIKPCRDGSYHIKDIDGMVTYMTTIYGTIEAALDSLLESFTEELVKDAMNTRMRALISLRRPRRNRGRA